ncbi:hypothetical protein J5N97_013510 [Dioscorea zingiberensis]|uniref:Uncharacterized protein n=1 Tax=Dioscorea zingiberensis TaxID=325984 RepID=A0A9D5CQP6_9LILI|nr:hypothetical protein J5N97_013510 [Dioscorea zingiberensis]
MEEHEFQRLLELFPVVRSRNYCAGLVSAQELTSHSSYSEITDRKSAPNGIDNDGLAGTPSRDTFWQKLRLTAEAKVGPEKAEHFCKAVQMVHTELVHKSLSLDAAQRFVNYGN